MAKTHPQSAADATITANKSLDDPTVKGKANAETAELPSSQPPAKAQTVHKSRSAPSGPRSPLPDREKRVRNPGAPDAKRAKRTSEEVAADIATKDQILRRVAELEAEKVQMLAELQIKEDAVMAEEEAAAVRCLGNLKDDDEMQVSDTDEAPFAPTVILPPTAPAENKGGTLRKGKAASKVSSYSC